MITGRKRILELLARLPCSCTETALCHSCKSMYDVLVEYAVDNTTPLMRMMQPVEAKPNLQKSEYIKRKVDTQRQRRRDPLNYETKKFVIRGGIKYRRENYLKMQGAMGTRSSDFWKRAREVNRAANFQLIKHVISLGHLKELEEKYGITQPQTFGEATKLRPTGGSMQP